MDPLATLKDLAAAPALGFALAWGWWILVSALVLTSVVVFIWQKKQIIHRYKKRLIRQELQALKSSSAPNKIAKVSFLLRRYANYRFKDDSIFSLPTKDFVEFLAAKKPLSAELKIALSQSAYQKNPNADEALFDYALRWLDV